MMSFMAGMSAVAISFIFLGGALFSASTPVALTLTGVGSAWFAIIYSVLQNRAGRR